MKKLSVILLIIFAFEASYSQGFKWVKRGGGAEPEYCNDIAIDNYGNIFVCGSFGYTTSGTYTATFGTQTIQNTTPGPNGYIAKYDTSGNVLWVKSIGGPDSEHAHNITIDNNGNVYISGDFKTSVTIDGVTVSTSDPNQFGAFIAKFLTNGTLVWLKSVEQNISVDISDIIVDDYNNVWITGIIDNWFLFLRKLNGTNGNQISHIQAVNNNGGGGFGSVLAKDLNNNIFLAAEYIGESISIGTFTLPALPFSVTNVLVAKFNNNCSPIWITTGGGNNTTNYALGFSIDELGNCYLESSIIDSVFWTNLLLVKTSSSWAKRYFVKINSNGVPIWLKEVPIKLSSIETSGIHIPISNGNLIFSLQYCDTIMISGQQFSSDGKSLLTIIADTALNIKGAYQTTGNSTYTPGIRSNTSDANNNIYIGGHFRDLATFGTIPLNSTGGNKADMFLAKIKPCLVPIINTIPSGNINLCLGGSFTVSADSINNGIYQWYLNGAPIQNATFPSYTVTLAGVYKVIVTINGGCQNESSLINVTSSSINAQLQAQPNVTSICQGSVIQIFTPQVYSSYVWSTGQTGISSISVSPGSYYVVINDFNNCVDTAFITIGEYPLPPQPHILQSGCILSSDITPVDVSYKWWFDNTGGSYQVVGTNNSSLNAYTTGNGFYKLELTDLNSCKNISNPTIISGCGNSIEEVGNIKHDLFNIFPQPAKEFIYVEKLKTIPGNITAYIFDEVGRQIIVERKFISEEKSDKLSIGSVESGNYYLLIQTDIGNQIFKIIKL